MPFAALVASLILLVVSGSRSFAQQTDSRLAHEFEVASIKQSSFPSDAYFEGFVSASGMCPPARMTITGTRIVFQSATLCGLISLAYDVKEHQVSGMPDWMKRRDQSNFYDIDARAAIDTSPTPVQARVMLQNLLAERSQLRVHQEPTDVPVYALVVGSNGHRLTEGVEIPCATPGSDFMAGPGLFASCKPSMSTGEIAQRLSRETDRVVVDKTGLTGKYAFRLQWSRDGALRSDLPSSIFTAVQEQIGLRLQPETALVTAVVIDHVQRPSPN